MGILARAGAELAAVSAVVVQNAAVDGCVFAVPGEVHTVGVAQGVGKSDLCKDCADENEGHGWECMVIGHGLG